MQRGHQQHDHDRRGAQPQMMRSLGGHGRVGLRMGSEPSEPEGQRRQHEQIQQRRSGQAAQDDDRQSSQQTPIPRFDGADTSRFRRLARSPRQQQERQSRGRRQGDAERATFLRPG
jgi:hypothetical protein